MYQHWDPLRVCVVGRGYPPEFFSWIKVPRVRELFERMAVETEEDFNHIIKKLQEFGVQVLRPELEEHHSKDSQGPFHPPPMNPRDSMIMIGDRFYTTGTDWQKFYPVVKDPSWDDYPSYHSFERHAPKWQQDEIAQQHKWHEVQFGDHRYANVRQQVKAQGNIVTVAPSDMINGAMVSRIGKDLYFSTSAYDQDQESLLAMINSEFRHTRNHVVNTGGHGDGTYCPVCPGLIISLNDVDQYTDTFPGWEVVYLAGQSWDQVKPFLDLKQKNAGRWWIPGFEHDNDVVDVVETWLSHWVGYVEETVFDVNMLIIDPKNVMVFNHNDRVAEALQRYGITPHVVPFRHRYFWDGGIHCVTLDLDRDGEMQDYFPARPAIQGTG